MNPFFSIIVVCFNPGQKLRETLLSIKNQIFSDYEIVIKDGLSSDGSLACVEEIFSGEVVLEEKKEGKVCLISKKDQGIYDAMNQAMIQAKGEYIYFLNCGDWFYSDQVLGEMAEFIRACRKEDDKETGQDGLGIYYGNIYERVTGQKVASNPRMDAFSCYRNVPCHQACFYAGELLLRHPFQTKYRVRADYEQFLWCFFVAGKEQKVRFAYRDLLIADYEGGGFSETKENKKISAAEHRAITKIYMSGAQLFRFRLVMFLSLAPLRTWIAQNERTAGLYNRIKEIVYAVKRR